MDIIHNSNNRECNLQDIRNNIVFTRFCKVDYKLHFYVFLKNFFRNLFKFKLDLVSKQLGSMFNKCGGILYGEKKNFN